MKKSRVFTLGVACFFCAITALGFVPFTSTGGATSASNSGDLAALTQSANSAPAQGLITPQEDDPVIYTTESGIEIKYGNSSLKDEIIPSLESGNLVGFPYIITNNGTSDYIWVIIGIGAGGSEGPAGLAISDDTISPDLIVHGDIVISMMGEIPPNSVLCLANDTVASGKKNNSVNDTYKVPSNIGISTTYKDYRSTYEGTMAAALDGYISQFGLSEISDCIQEMPLETQGAGAHTGLTTTTSSHKIFTLSGVSTDTFYYLNYLTATQASTGGNWWLRGADSTTITTNSGTTRYYYGQYVNSSGDLASNNVGTSYGYRPAFCLQI